MANSAEQRSSRMQDLGGGRRMDGPPAAEPSVPAALEKIASVSQRVLSKRIDLLMLDNHELISRLLVKAAALSVGVVTGLSAWLSALSAVVMWLLPDWSTAGRLAMFALLNAVFSAVVVAVVLRKPPKLSGETEEEREDEAEAARVSGSIGSMKKNAENAMSAREGERRGG
jgi:hypothetical protein